MVNNYLVYPLYVPKQFMKDTNTEPDKVGTTQAAFLLNISTARLRLLLRQGRLKGAEKFKRFWVIPLNT